MTRRMLIVVVLGGLASSLIGVVPAGAQACTISGTDGADNLVGTSNRDIICARRGNDRVVGRAGADELNGVEVVTPSSAAVEPTPLGVAAVTMSFKVKPRRT